MNRTLAIVEHNPVWQLWLDRSLPQLRDFQVASFDSAPALLDSNAMCQAGVLIVAYRTPGIDAFSWMHALRQCARSPSVRIIALVCAGDAFGKSMAVLAGADIAYLKGIDGELLRDDLLHWAGGGDASGRSTSRRRRDAACPLFDPRMIEFVGRFARLALARTAKVPTSCSSLPANAGRPAPFAQAKKPSCCVAPC
jgi:DNA-binding NarL/FixJ family response regulator